MLAITLNEYWHMIALALLSIALLVLFFRQAQFQRDAKELAEDLHHSQMQLEQLSDKYDNTLRERNYFEQHALQQKIKLEATLERLSERDNAISQLNQQHLFAQ